MPPLLAPSPQPKHAAQLSVFSATLSFCKCKWDEMITSRGYRSQQGGQGKILYSNWYLRDKIFVFRTVEDLTTSDQVGQKCRYLEYLGKVV